MAEPSRNRAPRAKGGTRRTATQTEPDTCRVGSGRVATLARDALAHAFDEIGGAAALAEWVKASEDNRRIFYTNLYPKLIALQPSAAETEAPEPIHEIRRIIVWP